MNELILSLFPGIGMLDRAFEDEGFCVVRGPDLLWGGDVTRFHPPAGYFAGVIGGPPCQAFSTAPMGKQRMEKDMIPEFVRCIQEADPAWWLMENVRGAYTPLINGYHSRELLLNNRWCDAGAGIGAEQSRMRKFVFGSIWGGTLTVDLAALQNPSWEPCVTAAETSKGQPGHGSYGTRRKPRSIERQLELSGLPADFLKDAPFTQAGKGHVIGNGVPQPMGRAIARAVRRAIENRAIAA